MVIEFRPYQTAAIDAAFDWFETQDGDPLIVLPTGTGKGVVQAAIIRQACQRDPYARVASITHVKELIAQNYKQLVNLWPEAPSGICSASLGKKDIRSQIIFGGIQSIWRHAQAMGRVDLLLIDEPHLMSGKSESMYGKFIETLRRYNPQMFVLGLTATPFRLDSGFLHKGANRVFQDICFEYSIMDAVNDGWLTELRTKSTDARIDWSGVNSVGGEYNQTQCTARLDNDDINQAVCAEIIARASNRKCWLIFASSIEHGLHIRDIMRSHGISAAMIASEGGDNRDESIAALRSGELRCLVNVNMATTGLDITQIDLIACLRRTQSAGLWIQMLGRGTRLHPGKQDCLVLDFTDNAERFGPLDRIKIKEKREGTGEGEAPHKVCPECYEYVHAAATECPSCGFLFPKPEVQIERKAAEVALLSSQIKPTWHDVREVHYKLHTKAATGSQSIKVEYVTAGFQTFAEWTGFTEFFWKRRERNPGFLPRPSSINEALNVIEQLQKPTQIATLPEGKFTKIVGYKWN